MQTGPLTKCQCCQASPLESILFVGYLPPVNTMPKAGQPLDEQPGYPLELVCCPACALAQINFVIEIQDINQLSRVLTRIENLPNVMEAHRLKAG